MNPKEAKKILPKKEYETFESILFSHVHRSSASFLKQRLAMARRLKNKYRDLAHHDAAGVRTRRTNEVDTDINDRRVQIFDDIIDCVQEALENVSGTQQSHSRA